VNAYIEAAAVAQLVTEDNQDLITESGVGLLAARLGTTRYDLQLTDLGNLLEWREALALGRSTGSAIWSRSGDATSGIISIDIHAYVDGLNTIDTARQFSTLEGQLQSGIFIGLYLTGQEVFERSIYGLLGFSTISPAGTQHWRAILRVRGGAMWALSTSQRRRDVGVIAAVDRSRR